MGTSQVLNEGWDEYTGGGQRWAAAKESVWSFRPHRWLGHAYQYRIVYCHTSQMQYAREGQPHAICLLHGGRASWERCSKCPDNWGFKTIARRSMLGRDKRLRVVLRILR